MHEGGSETPLFVDDFSEIKALFYTLNITLIFRNKSFLKVTLKYNCPISERKFAKHLLAGLVKSVLS